MSCSSAACDKSTLLPDNQTTSPGRLCPHCSLCLLLYLLCKPAMVPGEVEAAGSMSALALWACQNCCLEALIVWKVSCHMSRQKRRLGNERRRKTGKKQQLSARPRLRQRRV